MTTLLEIRTLDGKLIGRCDARCYDGTADRCFCICRGMNHNVGLVEAAVYTMNLERSFKQGHKIFPYDPRCVHFNPDLINLAGPALFDLHAPPSTPAADPGQSEPPRRRHPHPPSRQSLVLNPPPH